MAVNKGLRRIGRSWALDPGAAHAGHQSGMPDSIPLQQRNRPPSQRNTVRHHSGMLSAISPESCPSWRGTRTLFRGLSLMLLDPNGIAWSRIDGFDAVKIEDSGHETRCCSKKEQRHHN
jgi:hypothetical protein